MNWLDLHKPQYLKDLKVETNNIEIQKAIEWITNYKNKKNVPKVLFIMGDVGTGKTLLADLLLKEFHYKKIELNSSDVRSQKKISDFLIKSLTYRNVVDMFHEGNAPIGLLIDEIDTICKLSDKGGFTEFLTILKQNGKFETLKKNIAEKKKVKKKNILVDDYIQLYNPIICTSQNINDKKINELKKYSEVIYLSKPSNEDIRTIINNICPNTISDDLSIDIAEHCNRDIRRLIILLEDLHYFSKDQCITRDLFEKFRKTYVEKEEDIQLIDSTRLLISKKMSVRESQIYFDVDCLLTPLMIYHNSIHYIKNCEDSSKKKLNTYKNVLESLCINDTIQTSIFELQDWDDLYNIASIYGSTIPNYYLSDLKNKKSIEIEFTTLLNKISQMYVNKKLLSSAKFSIGKINFDTNELIYLTEIISYYFNEYKTNIALDDSEEDEDTIDDAENNHVISKDTNSSSLISFMNKYCINIDGLENILKIEKINQINEKRKKKFTIKIKKDICNFLVTKESGLELFD
jgi:hypothetical protein